MTEQAQKTVTMHHQHNDGRECRFFPDAWRYYDSKGRNKVCRREDHPTEQEVEQWFMQQARPEPPLLRQGSLNFPDKRLQWPVPMEVQEAVQEAFLAQHAAIYQRVSVIHHEEDGQCAFCGPRLPWPCPTITAVVGTQEGEQQMSEHEGERIESKEGEVVHEMKTSDEGVAETNEEKEGDDA